MPKQQKWNPDGCTLLPCVQRLIQQAYLSTAGNGQIDYQPVWMPDLPLGPASMAVAHNCRQMKPEMVGAGEVPIFSTGSMKVSGHKFMMCETPEAWHCVYISACHNCKTVFFCSAWDRDDTLENYIAELKARA